MIDPTVLLEVSVATILALFGISMILSMWNNNKISDSATTAINSMLQVNNVATQSVVSTASTAISSLHATSSEVLNALLIASGIEDVASIVNKKIEVKNGNGSNNNGSDNSQSSPVHINVNQSNQPAKQ
jgi:mannose/fructose/N-acetylgalactosamine-specific phosphotransferase system component IIB